MAGKSGTRERLVNCPSCNYRYHYRCAEGRQKGERRGKLFNHHPRERRNAPPPAKRGEIARLFRLGVPAARVAKDLGSHRNKAYRYCKPIRKRRAAARRAELDPIDVLQNGPQQVLLAAVER
ncbi:MAG: hypothetical protein GF399_06130 [Candidatus Coatesbacteria bacterium]|nr:hypothetical protein [Candidatus Coatesbacteria bacterium]